MSQYFFMGATFGACCADPGAIRESLRAPMEAATWLVQVQKISPNGAEGVFFNVNIAVESFLSAMGLVIAVTVRFFSGSAGFYARILDRSISPVRIIRRPTMSTIRIKTRFLPSGIQRFWEYSNLHPTHTSLWGSWPCGGGGGPLIFSGPAGARPVF